MRKKVTREHFSVAADGIMQAHIPIIAKTEKSPSVFGNVEKFLVLPSFTTCNRDGNKSVTK